MVADIKPRNYSATGRVIILDEGAICLPINAITEISSMFPVINKAWQSDSSQTFRFISFLESFLTYLDTITDLKLKHIEYVQQVNFHIAGILKKPANCWLLKD